MALIANTEIFAKLQEIYIRQNSNSDEIYLEFEYNGKSHCFWQIGITNDEQPEMDPDGFELDPLYMPALDVNDKYEFDEVFNPEVDVKTLHVVICTANEAKNADAEKIIVEINDQIIDVILRKARTIWPKMDDMPF